MRKAAVEGADACLLRRASHVQQAQQAIQALPATASACCGSPSQQQNEPNLHTCDLSVQQAPRLQARIQLELQSMQATAQHKVQHNIADERAHPNCSPVNGACDSSTAYVLQSGRCQQAAQPHFSQQEAQPAAHDGAVLHALAVCSSASAFVDGKAGRKASSHGSVWIPQSSLSPKVHCTAAGEKAEKSSQKRMLSGVASHKSVRRSLRHQAKAMV